MAPAALGGIMSTACEQTRSKQRAGESLDASAPPLPPADAATCPQPHCPETVYDRTINANPRRGVEVDARNLYWSEVSASDGLMVRAAPKDGSGPIRTLGKWYDFASSRSLAMDEGHVYWLRPTGGTESASVELVRVDKDGQNEQTTVVPAPDPTVERPELAIILGSDDSTFVATYGCGWILRIPKDGSAIQQWPVSRFPDAGGATGLELSGTSLYCANGAFIHRLDLASGSVIQVVSGQVSTGPMALIGESLYFINNDGDASQSTDNLAAVSPDGGPVQNLGLALGSTARMLYDAPRHTIFWVTGLTPFTGEVVAFDISGTSPPRQLLDGQDVLGNSAQDEDYVYWLSDHAVTRLRKWP
jgi:hypothetical protein